MNSFIHVKQFRETVEWIICVLLWQSLTVYCISNTYTYGSHYLTTSMQKISFYSVKGGLSRDEKPFLAGWKGIIWNNNHHHATLNNSANKFRKWLCTGCWYNKYLCSWLFFLFCEPQDNQKNFTSWEVSVLFFHLVKCFTGQQ